jgi:hypothetical protein
MLNYDQTSYILGQFFNACLKFWWSAGKDQRTAWEMAMGDIESLTTDPYSPCGEPLDEGAKAAFIKYRKMDLGNK